MREPRVAHPRVVLGARSGARRHPDDPFESCRLATFFLAWTGIGWVVLLILSFLGPTVYTIHQSITYVAPLPAPGVWAHCPTDPPHVRRWWDGRAWTAHTTVI